MNIEQLLERLKLAYKKSESLRSLAAKCDVSHEIIRKLLDSDGNNVNLTLSTYRKIDCGLKQNGF